MLIVLLYQIFIFLFCIMAGYFFYALFQGFEASRNKSLALHFISGLLVTTLISQWLVLWLPVQLTTTLVYVVLLTALFTFFKKDSSLFFSRIKNSFTGIRVSEWMLYGSFTVLVLLYTAGPTSMDDTESYHIQMIKWINEYGTVKGIAVLHERFGFNSSWFLAVAGFVPSNNPLAVYSILNGSLSLLLGYYLISELIRGWKEHQQAYCFSVAIILALCLACWPVIRGNAGNSNYDMITAVMLLILLLESLRQASQLVNNLSVEWMLWPVFLFTVRIINYPLLILSLAMLIWLLGAGKKRLMGTLVFAGFLLVIPFIARNVFLSGYPFYPLLTIDPFQVDWKPDPAIVQERIDFTKYFNRVNVMYMDIEETRQLPFPHWIMYWFRYLFRYDLPWVILGLSGILFGTLRGHYIRSKWGNGVFIVVLAFLIQALSWFIISPDPRFIYGTLIGGSFLLLYSIFSSIKIAVRIPLNVSAFIVGGLLLFYSAGLWIRKENLRNPVSPLALSTPEYKTVLVDGVPFHLPEKLNGHWNTRCFGTPLPCLYIMDPRIHLRGAQIQDGFRLE